MKFTAVVLSLLSVYCTIPSVLGQFSWATFTNAAAPQSGVATFYGPGGDAQDACSYGPNFANSLGFPATANTQNTIALNNVDFSAGLSCGMCVMYIGTGGGVGLTPLSTTTWTFAQVTNVCPECAKGSIDINTAGDGIWAEQWYAVDCDVGSSSLVYNIVQGSQYYFEMVVSNSRNPIMGVSAEIGGSWLDLTRTTNNQWAYYNSEGPYSFPLPIRVTCTGGQVLSDTMQIYGFTQGTVQCPAAAGSSDAAATTTPTVAAAATTISTSPPPPPVQSAAAVAASSPPPPITTTAPSTTAAPVPAAAPEAVAAANALSATNPNVNATAMLTAPPPPVTAVASSPPPPATTAAPTTTSATAVDVKATTPPATTAAPPPPAVSASPTPTLIITNWGQCGGTGSYCGTSAGATCVDAQWPGATCGEGFFCNRYDATWWQCQPYAGAGFGRGSYTTSYGKRRMSRRLASSSQQASSL